jgi:DNA/RNA-binding domain of Phe-tRNA-synthetase-like protein
VPVLMRHGAQSRHAQGLALIRAGLAGAVIGPAGQPVTEHPGPGEVIWRDDRGVTCRRWNWRQCARTRITATTTTAVFVLDGLAALGTAGLRAAAAELTEPLARLSPQARFASRLMGPGQT